MLYSIKDREDLENLNELVSLQDQVKAVSLRDNFGKQFFHEDIKKIFEPVAKSLESTSQDITKTTSENSFKNKQALENLNNKLLEIMNDRGKLASYLLSPLSKIPNPEITSQFKLVKDSTSNRVNDLLIHNTIPITLHDNLLTFRDTNKVFKLKNDLLKMITLQVSLGLSAPSGEKQNCFSGARPAASGKSRFRFVITNKNCNVDLSILSDKKILYDFAKEMNFDTKAQCKKSTRDRTITLSINTQIIVCLHEYNYSYNYMYNYKQSYKCKHI